MGRSLHNLDSVGNLLYCVLTILLIPSSSASLQSDCKIGDYDFSLLNTKEPWISVNPSNETFLFSFCSAIEANGCPTGSAVCRKTHGSLSQPVKLGNFTNSPTFSEDNQKRITVTFRGQTCSSNHSIHFSTHIIFKCGKTLGSPEFLNNDGCSTVFEWESIVACKHLSKPVKEVPCYVYIQGKKRDLTPLIKLSGAYKLKSPSNVDIYMNLCRDISSDNPCPNGAAICANISNTLVNLGEPKTGLRAKDTRSLEIKYEAPVKLESCSNIPQTVINLICPKRGGSKYPIIIHEVICNFDIEWLTEYACDETNINKPHSLKFRDPENDIDIDLTPLVPPKTKPYSVAATDPDKSKYTYYFSLVESSPNYCYGSEFENFNPAICQVKGNQIKYLGSFSKSTLRYSDGHLMLIYKGGQPCSSNFQRVTFIEFHCNKSAANDGKGSPVFRTDVDCSYYFDWDTKYACTDHPVLHGCSVSQDGKLFDLSSLRTVSGENWQALNGHHYNSNADVFLNVCHDIIPEKRTSGCPSGSAICMKGFGDKFVNLGRYTQGPVYNPSSGNIQLTYSEGDDCGKTKYKSIITFYCNPGVTNSAPVIILKSDDECVYNLEWHTAAACVQMQITGTNCRVSDDTSGYNFDLSPLIKKGKEKYEVSSKSYIYYLNICEKVQGTPCISLTTGVCQTKVEDHFAVNTGVVNSNLTYYNGILKLIYKDGDKYHTIPPTSRTTVITFLCSKGDKIGHPEFIEETNMTYWFSWYTQYACTSPPVECTFTDETTKKQYDLSHLSLLHTNWDVEDNTDPNEKKKYYINVCRPLSHIAVGHGCNTLAGVCVTKFVDGKEVVENENLGQITSGPKLVEKSSDLILRYTNGKQCIDSDNQTTNYSTTIHFMCKKTDLSNGPRFLNIENNCEYVFLWETEFACAETNTESREDCTIKDPNSNYVFNLQPLIKKSGGYEVKVNTRKLLINICAPLADTACAKKLNESAVCEIQLNRSVALASYSSKLQLTDGHLRLSYRGRKFISGDVFQVIIIFVCDPEHDLGTISFINVTQQLYTFQFATALACAPRPVDCIVQDQKGGQYDLTPLALPDTNWETTVKGTKYIINVCRPVNKKDDISCAGLVGGCQITTDKHAFNMGYVQGKPIALSDGTVSIRYRGGDICHYGTDKESHRSTRIDFFCSTVEEGIEFQSETEYCEYVFSWKTPAACVVRRVEGDHCKVMDPLYHNEFNLSPLRNNISDYVVKTDEYIFYINVCGALVSSHDCPQEGTAACQTKPSINLKMKTGSASDKLIYDDGAIILKYENGEGNCHKNYTRKTIITFTCDHAVSGFQGPSYLNEAGDCTYLFEWPTKYACSQMVISPCKVQNSKGEEIDLSNLALSNNNYIYETPRLAGQKFILNVCHSLVHRKGETCASTAGACRIVNESDPLKRYHNIGQVGSHPLRYNNGDIELVYENGEPCQSPNRKNSSTHIKFVCDMNAEDTDPSEYSVSHGCEHHFMWLTREACPIRKTLTNNDTCRVTDPNTGVTFDLSQLRSLHGYSVPDRVGHVFKLNVCGKVKSLCANTSGSCQIDLFNNSFNAGNANGKLQFENGIVFLNYSGGDKCHHGKFERNTIINFVCNPSAKIGQPMFIDESDDCTYYFSWHTSLVCEKKVHCSVSNGSQIFDLSPLIKMSGSHIAQAYSYTLDPGSSFYINICRPLNPISGILCPPGASACRIKDGEKPISLGSVTSGPYIDSNDQRVTLKYQYGDKCPHDNTQNRSSVIKFTCNPGLSLGYPVLLEAIEDCTYIFNWETYIVCPVSLPHKETDCVYNDTQTLTEYNLTSLKNAGVQKIPDGSSGFYYLSVCASVGKQHSTVCKSSGVCHVNAAGKEISFGDMHKAMISMKRDLVTLTYENEEKCNESTGLHPNSKIHFLCDANAGLGKPVFFDRMTCETSFLWKTKYVCPPVLKECYISHLGNNYDLGVLANTHSWKVMDISGNTYWINVCQALHNRPKSPQCPGNAAVCMQKRDKKLITLGTVSSQILYIDIRTPVNNPVIILQYSSDKPVCANNKNAKIIIRFSCANVMGAPHFSKKNEENCTYEFIWKTRIACKEKRVPVNDVNGILTDPRTMGRIYFGNLTHGKTFHAKEFQGPVLFKYDINFDGRLRLDPSKENSQKCQGAAVCQTKPSDTFYYKNLGNAQNKNFYLDVDFLDLEITSPEKCRSNPSKNVKTIIEFFCSHLASADHPKFVYESNECLFLFTWTSSISCFHYDTIPPRIKEDTADTHSTSNTTLTVIGVFSGLLVLSIILLVLSRPEKRAFMMEKMKSLFTRKHTGTARYINVSQMDDDEGLLVMDAEGGNTSVPYHDDSDEDMIL